MPYLFGNNITICKKRIFLYFGISDTEKPYFKEKISQSIWIYLNLTKPNQDVSRECLSHSHYAPTNEIKQKLLSVLLYLSEP